MTEAENLRLIAEVGIAIAGFSGVVAALSPRTLEQGSASW